MLACLLERETAGLWCFEPVEGAVEGALMADCGEANVLLATVDGVAVEADAREILRIGKSRVRFEERVRCRLWLKGRPRTCMMLCCDLSRADTGGNVAVSSV